MSTSSEPLRLRHRLTGRAVDALLPVLLLGVAFTAMRALAMLGPSAWRVLFLLHCVAMAAVPWLLLDRDGRRRIGLQRPRHWARALWQALALGVPAAALCFWLGSWWFGHGVDNWFVSVGNSFRAQPTPGFTLWQLHAMFTLPAILFSPVGEEIFFRGLLQRALENRLSARRATAIESAWFAVAHLCHHGLLVTAAGLTLLPLSGALWVGLMFGLSTGLAALRRRHDSLVPAMLAHAAFNATMNGFIFACLW